MMHDAVFHRAFSARLRALRLVSESLDQDLVSTQALSAAAEEVAALAGEYGSEHPAAAYGNFSELLRIYINLVRWVRAVRAAETEAKRFLDAARLGLDEHMDDIGGKDVGDFSSVVEAIRAVENPTDVPVVQDALLKARLAIGLIAGSQRLGIRIDAQRRAGGAENEAQEKLNVAFLDFTINGRRASQLNYLKPNVAHDLGVEVKVSRWPRGAETLRLDPVSVEPEDCYKLPSFEFGKVDGDGPFTFNGQDRLLLKIPHSIQARPYEFKYAVSFSPTGAEQPIEILGHRTLRVEGTDLGANSVSGYAEIDERLLELRDRLRTMSGVPDEDIASIMNTCAVLGNLAGQSVQSPLFLTGTVEKDFQSKVVEWLRRSPTIGEHLEEHPHAAGGITDLSFNRIRIELKAESKARLDVPACGKFVDQIAAYVVGTGKRVGVLCALDSSPKTEPVPPAASQMDIVVKEIDGIHIAILVMIVQGGLGKPSSYSC